MGKVLIGLPVALAAAAAVGQVAAGRWASVVVPDQDYSAGNDTWAFQLVLLTWIAASSAVLGAAAARLVAGEIGRSHRATSHSVTLRIGPRRLRG
ncbi:MAG: hypothetical protein HOV79_14745 [Hamadaea sp.]|nr:hypothetical protein [Hamadaea sp.]